MEEKAKAITIPKVQLEITKIGDPVSYGTAGKTLLPIYAKNLSLAEGDPLAGKAIKYVIFNPTLAVWVQELAAKLNTYGTNEKTPEVTAAIVNLSRFLADVEERERPNSEYGPDRNIVQIYDKGGPVSKSTGKNPGNWRRSLEEDLALVAVAQVGAILTAGEIEGEGLGIDEPTWNRILAKYWKAIEKGLDLIAGKQTGNQGGDNVKNRRQTIGERPEVASTEEQVSNGAKAPKVGDWVPLENIGQLLTRAKALGFNPSDVAIIAGVHEPKEIKDLDGTWKKIIRKINS